MLDVGFQGEVQLLAGGAKSPNPHLARIRWVYLVMLSSTGAKVSGDASVLGLGPRIIYCKGCIRIF